MLRALSFEDFFYDRVPACAVDMDFTLCDGLSANTALAIGELLRH